ncbi:tripartite motif containing 105 isoform X1 [Carcharodon carcharias]|uniref:tripartite motif containing 105 isoform X1 n=1 Tax=Carcharodon carcharias TaxID=13397 RepID=UPI001B7E91FA|nr:tripartite motif containing 105 isoform X1 [Carcharodon carcharias]
MEGVTDELTCCICCEMFQEPVMLECMHHFCKRCILRFWRGSRTTVSCPQCRRQFDSKKFRTNYLVAGVVEKMRGASTQDFRLRLQKHLSDVLKCHRDQVDMFVKMKKRDEEKIVGIQTDSADLQLRVRSDFERMHQILWKEESSLVSELQQDEASALEKLESHVQQLNAGLEELEQLISCTQGCLEQLKSTVLIETRGLARSVQVDGEPDVRSHFRSARYTGPLQYIIWKKMYKSLEPAPARLTFDLNTAHPNLAVSEDLTSVTEANEQQPVPNNPERFDKCVNVLASQGFSSGRHYWEVGVDGKTKWDLGVAKESVDRKVVVKVSPCNGYWTLRLRNTDQYWAGTLPWKRLPIQRKPKRIGLFLDFDAGRLSFYNAEDMSHLLTFRQPFSERVFPFFSTCFNEGGLNSAPLRLCQISP